MPSGTYTYTLYTITGSGNSNFTVTGSFTVTIFDSDDNLGVGDDSPGTETGAAPVIQSLGAGAPAGWNVGDEFFFGGSRGIEVGSPTDDFLIPRVGGSWQTTTALYSLPGASTPLVVGQTYNREGAAGNVDEEVAPCFVAGTLIKTSRGEIPVEYLARGDMVFTLDGGFRPVQWVGAKTVDVTANTAPIRFETGTTGNDRPLLVSPNHRMLLRSTQADLLFDNPEVLIPAKHMTKMRGVTQVWPKQVTYVHVLFDSHQIICANGAMSESFHPGAQALSALEMETRQEILDLFPELARGLTGDFATARSCPKPHEVSVLLETIH
jgi:hypothetical protein